MALVKDLIDVSDDDEVVCLDDSSGDDSVVCLDDLDGDHRRPELTVSEVLSEDHPKKYEDSSNNDNQNVTSYHHHETIKPKIELPESGQWTLVPKDVFTNLGNYYPILLDDGPPMVSYSITLSPNGQTAEPDWVDLPLVVRAVDSGRAADHLDEVPDDDVLASLDDQWKEDRSKAQKRERARVYYHTRKGMKQLTEEQKEARVKSKQEAREKLREKKLAYRKEKKMKKVEPKPKRHGSEVKYGPPKRRGRPPKVTTFD